MSKPILLDIMQGDTFIMQMRYNKRGYPEMIDGKLQEVHKLEDITEFVYSKRPSLRGKGIKIKFSNQQVY